MVGTEGLEPTLREEADFESAVSTTSTTSRLLVCAVGFEPTTSGFQTQPSNRADNTHRYLDGPYSTDVVLIEPPPPLSDTSTSVDLLSFTGPDMVQE